MNTREARFQRALLRSDIPALWTLLRERNSDDAAPPIRAAARPGCFDFDGVEGSWQRLSRPAAVCRCHSRLSQLSEDPKYAAESQYQLARIHFLNEDYAGALDGYRAVVAAFPGTDWEKDAGVSGRQFVLAPAPVRGSREGVSEIPQPLAAQDGNAETATRDLVDVYRSLGQNDKAISLIDRTLASKVSAATRQVLLFTKVKILYSQQKFSSCANGDSAVEGLQFPGDVGRTIV